MLAVGCDHPAIRGAVIAFVTERSCRRRAWLLLLGELSSATSGSLTVALRAAASELRGTGLLVRHEREQAPTASSGTAACPGVATLLLNARSRRAGCLLASTSGAPGGCSGVALARRPMLVAQSSSFMRGARPRDAVAAAWSEHRALTPRSHAKRTQESRLTSSAVRAWPGAGRDRHPDQSRVPPSTAIARRCSY